MNMSTIFKGFIAIFLLLLATMLFHRFTYRETICDNKDTKCISVFRDPLNRVVFFIMKSEDVGFFIWPLPKNNYIKFTSKDGKGAGGSDWDTAYVIWGKISIYVVFDENYDVAANLWSKNTLRYIRTRDNILYSANGMVVNLDINKNFKPIYFGNIY